MTHNHAVSDIDEGPYVVEVEEGFPAATIIDTRTQTQIADIWFGGDGDLPEAAARRHAENFAACLNAKHKENPDGK